MENETQKQITALVAKINNVRNNAKFICDKLNDPNFMDLLWVANNEQKIEDLAKSLVGQSTSVVVTTTKSIYKPKKAKRNNASMRQHGEDYRNYLKQCELTNTAPLKWTEWLKVNHPAKNGSSMWYQTMSNITTP